MRLDHFAFQVSDIDMAVAFYTQTLGFKLLSIDVSAQHNIKYAFLDLNGAKIELLQNLSGSFPRHEISEPFCPHCCIEVDDIHAAEASLKANGVSILSGPTACAAGEVLIYFADPDGNIIEYLQWLKG